MTVGDTEKVEVTLEDLCVIVEIAVERASLYMDRPLFPCWERLPRRVHDRLVERQNERTERQMPSLTATVAHSEGREHDASICFTCVSEVVGKKVARRGR